MGPGHGLARMNARAITIRQPWASLVAVGAKTIETKVAEPEAALAAIEEENGRLSARLTSLDELLTPEQRRELSDDLADMARARRRATGAAADWPMS